MIRNFSLNNFGVQLKYIITIAVVLISILSVASAEALSVSPVRIELTVDPGESLEGSYRLTNDSNASRTYYSSFQNFRADGESGTPYFIQENEGLAAWLDGPESVTLAPYETREISYVIETPQDAQPGGYFAASFWMTSPADGEGSQSTVSFRVGILMLVRVSGDILEEGGIVDFAAEETSISQTPVNLQYRFRNGGMDRLKPEGTVTIKNLFGTVVSEFDANPQIGNVLPESRRLFELTWEDEGTVDEDIDNPGFFDNLATQWRQRHFGPYNVELNVIYGSDKSLSDTKVIRIMVLPTELMVTILVLLTLIFFTRRSMKLSMQKAIKRQAAILAHEYEEKHHHEEQGSSETKLKKASKKSSAKKSAPKKKKSKK